MKKNSEIIEDIILETYRDEISWKNERTAAWSEYVYNSNFVVRLFSCSYQGAFTLLFVERKYPMAHGDYADVAEDYEYELMIFKDLHFTGSFNKGNMQEDDLFRLSSAIDSKNEGMKSFLEMFK